MRKLYLKIYERVWRMLPDNCDFRSIGCDRRGVRGNENRFDGHVLCDDCYVRYAGVWRVTGLLEELGR